MALANAEGLRRARQNAAFLASSHSLKRLTQICIIKNQKRFCLAARLEPDPFSRLSKDMKNELMALVWKEQAETAEEADVQSQVLQLLLNSKTSTFWFPMSLGDGVVPTQLCSALLKKRLTGLHTLVRKSHHSDDGTKDWNIRPFVIKMLPVLVDLQALYIEQFFCDNADLARIARRLTKLRVIEVQLSPKVTREGIAALTELKLLKELVFFGNHKEEETLLVHCFELLPRLHVAVLPPKTPNTVNWNLMQGWTFRALRKMVSPCTLHLHHLVLYFLHFLPSHVAFPQVRVLDLGGLLRPLNENQLAPDGLFPELEEINVQYAFRGILISLLEHGAGHKLQTLRVTNLLEQLQPLDWLLDHCPNLTELCIGSNDMNSNGQQPPQLLRHPKSLRRLKILRLDICGRRMQRGLLLELLLLAPNLQVLDFGSQMLDVEDLVTLEQLVNEGECLRHLESLRVTYRQVTEQWQHHFDQLIITCTSRCEKLRELVVGEGLKPWCYT